MNGHKRIIDMIEGHVATARLALQRDEAMAERVAEAAAALKAAHSHIANLHQALQSAFDDRATYRHRRAEMLREQTSEKLDRVRQWLFSALNLPGFAAHGTDELQLVTDAGRWFVAMADRLIANRHKGRTWLTGDPIALLRRVREELDELEQALVTGDALAIRHQAADVANMAMMVADSMCRDRA